jgi:hypothetical protein
VNPVIVTLSLILTAEEIWNPSAGDVQPPAGGQLFHNGFNYSPAALNSLSAAWPVKGCAYVNVPVGNSTVTLDLTNIIITLPSGQTYTTNANNTQVRGVIATTLLTGNINSIVIQPGASNAYNLDGSSFEWTVGPGEARTVWKGNNAPVINSTTKILKFIGTHNSDSIDLGFVFG